MLTTPVNIMKFMKPLYLTAYQWTGFAILSSFMVGIIGYAVLMGFFYFNTSWVAPTVLSVTSDRMLQYSQAYQAAIQNIDTLNVTYHQAERDLEYSKQNVDLLAKALSEQNSYMKQTSGLNKSTRGQIDKSYDLSKQLETMRGKALKQREAGLLTTQDMIQTETAIQSFQNQVTQNDQNLATLKVTASAQVIQLSEQLRQATNDIYTKTETVMAAKHSLDIAQENLKLLQTTSYYQAMLGHGSNLMFVAYDNRRVAKVGNVVYDCYLEIIACHKVGVIQNVYNDEQLIDFPLFNIRLSRTVRGFFVDVKVDDPNSMGSVVMFVGKPLGI